MKQKIKEKILLFKVRTKRDPEAFGELYDMYVERIYRFVYFKISNKEEAEDITSDIFLKVWNYLIDNQDKEIQSFAGFVYRITRNAVIDFYRERAKKTECSIENLVIVSDDKTLQNIETSQEVVQLLETLKKLKQEYQEVILLRHVEELSISEISEILSKKKTNVRVILHRATKKLKELSENHN